MQAAISYSLEQTEIQGEWQLVKAAQSDAAAFEPLYNKYYERIFRFVYQRLNGMDEAAEITQQVFVKAYQKLPGYTFQGVPFSAWLFRIASNDLAQHFRDKKKEQTINIESTADVHLLVDELEEEAEDELVTEVLQQLETLPYDDVQLIEMRFFEKRSFSEIADIIGTTEATAKMRLYRLLEKMKKALTKKQP